MSSRQRQVNSLRSLFPLTTIKSVVDLFRRQLDSSTQPDLSFLSLIIGHIELSLTISRLSGSLGGLGDHVSGRRGKTGDDYIGGYDVSTSPFDTPSSRCSQGITLDKDDLEIPVVKWEAIQPLYKKFITQIKGSVDLSEYPKKTSRELIKKVSDVIWSNLTRSYYKDKAHLQTLYSYMTGNKLDCFGVSYAVVAACQILELDDVRLSLSEDHAWVVFGEPGNEQTAEVTWHGKGNEDKRGQPVVSANCWIYLNGYPVVCTPQMTIAALVSSINPSINSTTESEQLATLQQKLLWLLYEKNHLQKYPMALGNLGDLEEVCPTPGVPKGPLELYYESIEVNKRAYANHHVYPYCYLASYYFRNGRFKEALHAWAEAATVIKSYNYTRDDEEIYKEFLEIANDLIPHMVKVVSAGGCEPGKVSKIPLLQDPECFASLLVFYDGLCGWEEESSTPVLHIGWAKPFVGTISKFTSHVRNKVKIKVKDGDSTDEESQESTEDTESQENQKNPNSPESHENGVKTTTSNGGDNESSSPTSTNGVPYSPIQSLKTPDEIIKSIEEDLKEDGERIEKDLKSGVYNKAKDEIDPQIAKLAAACSEQILNPDYLLGDSSQPTIDVNSIIQSSSDQPTSSPSSSNLNKVPSSTQDGVQDSNVNDFTESKIPLKNQGNGTKESSEAVVHLASQKMVGLKDLLLADKLNTSAIQLQLTAQSQVHLSKRPRVGSFGSGHQQPEFDFLATTTIATSIPSLAGHRTSKRIRRD